MVALLLTSVLEGAEIQVAQATSQEIIPNNAQLALKRLEPNGRIVELNDLEEGLRQQFADDYPKRHPAIVSSDFDGNGLTDYALLLRSEKSGKAIERLVVLLQMSKGDFRAHALEEFKDFLESIFIRVRSAGTIQERDSETVITLRLPGIERRFFEKSAGVYYWDKKGFRFVPTED